MTRTLCQQARAIGARWSRLKEPVRTFRKSGTCRLSSGVVLEAIIALSNAALEISHHSRPSIDGHGVEKDGEKVRRHKEGAKRQHATRNEDFDVRWSGEDDPSHPRSMSRLRKWIIVAIVPYQK
ncbi:MAG: hypothetical protein LQ351_000855 [Letrouitia transgressa]|nr:MAG: hypothetical protein LQ351_000855 [Letrouitia transgressa]